MKTLIFEGHSDDTFGEYGVTNDDVDNCASLKPIHCEIRSGDEGMRVTGQYGQVDGGWIIGISLLDEDVPLPEWPTRFRTPLGPAGYSPSLQIDVPDDFELTWYNDRKAVEQ